MKWRKQHSQILNHMTHKQEKALYLQLKKIESGPWSRRMTGDELMEEVRKRVEARNGSDLS